MNYERIYYSIIEKYKTNTSLLLGLDYFETHHIMPKCLGGKDTEENLVSLPVREHILLHIILTRIYPNNYKILLAANCMVSGLGSKNERLNRIKTLPRISTKLIADIKRKSIEYLRNYGIACGEDGKVVFKAKTAVCFDKNFNVIRTYYPVKLCKLDGFYFTSICRACREQISYANYNWAYKEDFEVDHQNELNRFYERVSIGDLPTLDTTYNKLSYKERLKLRPKRKHTEESKKKISESNKGKIKNISPEMKKISREKANQTKLKNKTFSGRKRISVLAPDGKIYDSLTDCGNAYKVTRHTIKSWVKNHPEKGFKYTK